MDQSEAISHARQLMDDFAERTLSESNIYRRYLWTDAFAVQSFFGFANVTGDQKYHDFALELIDRVHQILGKYRDDDVREGWISGFSEEKGQKHPTIGGLRIGKDLPERKEKEAFDNNREWDRDGQYFHYLTRWTTTLFQAAEETGEEKYDHWAAELIQTAEKFITGSGDNLQMYWKMSTDLDRPLVPSMGAHDPLEGALLVNLAKERVPKKATALDPIVKDLEKICKGKDWSTEDPLGIGGLLLNVPRSSEVANSGLPSELSPDKIYNDALIGLENYELRNSLNQPAYQRLAFRECGLSLGIRVMQGYETQADFKNSSIKSYVPLADQIETFWVKSEHQQSKTWKNHQDINAVSLAASLLAKERPQAFLLSRE